MRQLSPAAAYSWILSVVVLCNVQGRHGVIQAATDESPLRSSSWTLYHAVITSNQDASFEKRGSISLRIPDSGSAAVLTMENADFTSATTVTEQLLDVATAPKLYQLKLVSEDDKSLQPIVTTVPACQVLRANFRDEITLTMDSNANVLSMAYIPLVSPLAPKSCQDLTELPSTVAFDSKVSLEMATPGMTLRTILPTMPKPPPGLKFLAKAKVNAAATGAGAGPGGAGQQEQQEPITGPMGFFKRYWYIIVPLLLMNMFAPQPPPEEEGAKGKRGAASTVQGANGAGAAAATASVAAATLEGTPTPKRRGKKG